MSEHDHEAAIRRRAARIADLVQQVADERSELRRELTAADRTGRYGREQLVAAAKGGLSRAAVLAHLGDLAGRVRRALAENGLVADVTSRRDGSVGLAHVELAESRAEVYVPYSAESGDQSESDGDAGLQTVRDADRIALTNAAGALVDGLRRQGLVVSGGGGDPVGDLVGWRPVVVSREGGRPSCTSSARHV